MKLSQYIISKKIKAAHFARAIGVNRSTVHRFCDGTRRPDLSTLQRIHEETNGEVSAQDFFTPPRKRARKSEAHA